MPRARTTFATRFLGSHTHTVTLSDCACNGFDIAFRVSLNASSTFGWFRRDPPSSRWLAAVCVSQKARVAFGPPRLNNLETSGGKLASLFSPRPEEVGWSILLWNPRVRPEPGTTTPRRDARVIDCRHRKSGRTKKSTFQHESFRLSVECVSHVPISTTRCLCVAPVVYALAAPVAHGSARNGLGVRWYST